MHLKKDQTICSFQDTHLSYKDKQTQSKGVEDEPGRNGIQETVCVIVLISDKIDFKIKMVKETKTFILINGTMHQEDITHQYICIQPGSTKTYKAITNKPKGRN